MPEQMSMDDILGDKPAAPVAAPEPAPAAEPAAPTEGATSTPSNSLRKEHQRKEFEAQGRDPDTGKFIAKEEPKPEPKAEDKPAEPAKPVEVAKPAAPVQEEMTPKEKAAFAKAADETRKRQALEAQLRELQARMPQAQAAPAEAPKTFWDDPDVALKQQQAAVHQAIVGSRLQTSEAIARSRHTDFDEKVSIFSELAQNTPGLAQQMLAAPDPAEFVYRTAASHKAIQDAGGLEKMREKIEAETTVKVRAQLEAELNAKAEAIAKERAALPGSLSGAPSKGNQRPVWNGPPSMDDILKD